MALDASDIVIAGNGSVNVAPVGTALPTNPTTALPAAWKNLGYITEDGATFRYDQTKEPVNAWQSFYPLKYRVTGTTAEFDFVLMQMDVDTMPFAFGGGTVTTVAGPPVVYKYTPPNPEDIDERALVLEWVYDTSKFRLVTPRAMLTSGTEVALSRGSETTMPVTLGVLGTAGVAAFEILTDHPGWAAA